MARLENTYIYVGDSYYSDIERETTNKAREAIWKIDWFLQQLKEKLMPEKEDEDDVTGDITLRLQSREVIRLFLDINERLDSLFLPAMYNCREKLDADRYLLMKDCMERYRRITSEIRRSIHANISICEDNMNDSFLDEEVIARFPDFDIEAGHQYSRAPQKVDREALEELNWKVSENISNSHETLCYLNNVFSKMFAYGNEVLFRAVRFNRHQLRTLFEDHLKDYIINNEEDEYDWLVSNILTIRNITNERLTRKDWAEMLKMEERVLRLAVQGKLSSARDIDSRIYNEQLIAELERNAKLIDEIMKGFRDEYYFDCSYFIYERSDLSDLITYRNYELFGRVVLRLNIIRNEIHSVIKHRYENWLCDTDFRRRLRNRNKKKHRKTHIVTLHEPKTNETFRLVNGKWTIYQINMLGMLLVENMYMMESNGFTFVDMFMGKPKKGKIEWIRKGGKCALKYLFDKLRKMRLIEYAGSMTDILESHFIDINGNYLSYLDRTRPSKKHTLKIDQFIRRADKLDMTDASSSLLKK